MSSTDKSAVGSNPSSSCLIARSTSSRHYTQECSARGRLPQRPGRALAARDEGSAAFGQRCIALGLRCPLGRVCPNLLPRRPRCNATVHHELPGLESHKVFRICGFRASPLQFPPRARARGGRQQTPPAPRANIAHGVGNMQGHEALPVGARPAAPVPTA